MQIYFLLMQQSHLYFSESLSSEMFPTTQAQEPKHHTSFSNH